MNLTLFKFHVFILFQVALSDTSGVVSDMSGHRMTKFLIFMFKELLNKLLSQEMTNFFCHLNL